MKIVLLGAPGSGKGTQAVSISQKYKIPHISTGDIFRENISKKTPLGLKVKAIIDGGNLCPDDVTFELVAKRLEEKDCQNGFLLDGFPRNLVQAKLLDSICPVDVVLDLEINPEKLEHRITGRRCCKMCDESFHVDYIGDTMVCPTCGGELFIRKDDNVETVRTRLSVYNSQTFPLIDFYKEQGKLVVINGDQTVEQVFEDIVKALK